MTDDDIEPEKVYADRPGAQRRRRGPVLIAGGFVLVAGVSIVGALGLGGGSGAADGDGSTQNRSSQVVQVEKGTLTEQTEIDGQLGHGPEVPFPVKAEGTITWLPEAGKTLQRGEAVLRVNDRPVVLLYGNIPMYRDLGVRRTEAAGAASDDSKGSGAGSAAGAQQEESQEQAPATTTPLHGMDVKQFETNLSALGYTGFTVDQSYTQLTANAVKRWQEDLGIPQTGRVDAGAIVYASGSVRIAGTSVGVGADAAGNPVSYTSKARMVTVNAPATDTSWATTGSIVTVDLPDGRSVKGEVASVGKEVSPGDGAAADEGGDGGGEGKAATVAVVVTFDNQEALGKLQSGPVTVRYLKKQRKDVLNVPVAALVALAEGGYGLEVADGNADGTGSSRFIPVKTGLFAGGQVEVSGPGVREGMNVRIPK